MLETVLFEASKPVLMTSPNISILYLDRYHLGDSLFLQALGRAVARGSGAGLRPLLVHGQGEHVQRKLEGEGIFIEAERDVFQGKTGVEQHIIETAHRDLNRRLVGLLTEAIVPAVGFMGSDRDLLRTDGQRVTTGSMEWLDDVLERRVVPVIGATAREDGGGATAIDPVEAITAFANHVGVSVEVVMFTTNNLGGIMRGSEPIAEISINEAVNLDAVPDPKGAEMLVFAGASVLLTNTVRFPQQDSIRGTKLVSGSS